jgi:hypothetical protein
MKLNYGKTCLLAALTRMAGVRRGEALKTPAGG